MEGLDGRGYKLSRVVGAALTQTNNHQHREVYAGIRRDTSCLKSFLRDEWTAQVGAECQR